MNKTQSRETVWLDCGWCGRKHCVEPYLNTGIPEWARITTDRGHCVRCNRDQDIIPLKIKELEA